MQGSDWLLGRGVCASVGGGRSQRSSAPFLLPPPPSDPLLFSLPLLLLHIPLSISYRTRTWAWIRTSPLGATPSPK